MAVVDLADVKAHLNIPETTTAHDTALQGFCDAAQGVVEDVAGPMSVRTITGETRDGGSDTIFTLFYPIIAVNSLTEYYGGASYPLTSQPLGSTVSNYGYEVVDATYGIIVRRGYAGLTTPFMAGCNGVVISYTAGRATVPPQARLAALEIVRHWWQFGQQGSRPGIGSLGGEDAYEPAGPYMIPRFSKELLLSIPGAPKKELPGFA